MFITQSSFPVPKDVELNTIYFSIMKIPYRKELQQTAINHSSDIDFRDFMRRYIKNTSERLIFKSKYHNSSMVNWVFWDNLFLKHKENPLKLKNEHLKKTKTLNLKNKHFKKVTPLKF